jgi:hypothetical protein
MLLPDAAPAAAHKRHKKPQNAFKQYRTIPA